MKKMLAVLAVASFVGCATPSTIKKKETAAFEKGMATGADTQMQLDQMEVKQFIGSITKTFAAICKEMLDLADRAGKKNKKDTAFIKECQKLLSAEKPQPRPESGDGK